MVSMNTLCPSNTVGTMPFVPLDDWRMHITPTQLIRSRGFKPREISLAEIAGVGLLCKLGSRSSGWYTVVWLATGEPMGVSPTAVSNIKTPKGHWVWYGVNYVPPLDWQAVAAGRAARIARRIYDAVISAQGDNGLLATTHLERGAAMSSARQVVGIWAPDGYMRNANGEVLTPQTPPD